MIREIKRRDWSRFCKKFSTSNQFRSVEMTVRQRGQRVVSAKECFPLMGMALAKKGRKIDGIALFAGRPDPDRPIEPVITVRQPQEILLEQGQAGQNDKLKIVAGDGTEAIVLLPVQGNSDSYDEILQQVAYALFERRGENHGDDWQDWYEAKERLDQARLHFI